jgi:hypothetical protein
MPQEYFLNLLKARKEEILLNNLRRKGNFLASGKNASSLYASQIYQMNLFCHVITALVSFQPSSCIGIEKNALVEYLKVAHRLQVNPYFLTIQKWIED